MIKSISIIITFAFSLLSLPAVAGDWICKNGMSERVVRVQYEVPGQPVPCLVVYEKRDEGATDYPWNAKGQVGYCEEKADYLKERLEGFGWQCDTIAE